MMKICILFILIPFLGYSQPLTLDQCIDTAIQNNLTIRKSHITTNSAEITYKNSKQNLIPSVNGGISHGYNWGQTIDLFTNQFATDRVMYDNFYFNSSFVLFSGLQNYYTIKANKILVQESELDWQITVRNVKIDVTSAFLQVLLNKEIVKLSMKSIEKSTVQFERIKELVNARQATEFELSEIEAQLQLDRYLQTKAINDLQYSKLLLQQLLNVSYSENFELMNGFSDTTVQIVDLEKTTSISDLPEVLKIDLGIQSQVYLLKSTRGRYYPSLNLTGSMGSGYSENNKILADNGEFEPKPFREQVNSNFYQSVVVTINIPIFNKNATRNQVKLKELELESFYLDKQSEYNQLKQKLEQLSMDISNTSIQIEALEKVNESALLNYSNFQIRYENGEATFTQLTEANNKLFQAQSDLLQAKYQLFFKQTVLGFYYE